VELGPVFANFVLTDEINRAPAKVQSALLEVMAEKQVTIGGETFAVDRPFLVLATQNPIESEGVYQLPEAQRDRFLMKVPVDYPAGPHEELEIVRRAAGDPVHPRRSSPWTRSGGCRPPPAASTSIRAWLTTPCGW
jgi:MoxR-like ATPase